MVLKQYVLFFVAVLQIVSVAATYYPNGAFDELALALNDVVAQKTKKAPPVPPRKQKPQQTTQVVPPAPVPPKISVEPVKTQPKDLLQQIQKGTKLKPVKPQEKIKEKTEILENVEKTTEQTRRVHYTNLDLDQILEKNPQFADMFKRPDLESLKEVLRRNVNVAANLSFCGRDCFDIVKHFDSGKIREIVDAIHSGAWNNKNDEELFEEISAIKSGF